ncbi:protein NRT1/ PTR FAMILY 4.2-like [Rhodamnia argentea]|uniref:Protein NRT1/ PTR FAMILY 4.2-like n=1 Tax=Rhodamnia argentea TaxID=178133 RepID=A0A8B8QKR9_9MYRT|nr:protein NRT1/ PTR FAMILY 4.2-like [Rhodamnia argentea]
MRTLAFNSGFSDAPGLKGRLGIAHVFVLALLGERLEVSVDFFMDTEVRANERDEYVDWKGRKADSEEHGGIRPASLTCAVEVLENMVFLSNGSNFVAYFIGTMHYPTAVAANMVTNFMGTSFLLTIFAGFISDSFLTRFVTFAVSCTVELLGLIVLTIQAHSKSLQPPDHRRPNKYQAAVLYFGLYAMATGVGGIKASLPTHGADQLDHGNQRLVSAFFNWFFFSLCTGGLVTATVMVWVEENLGWRWSFKISIAALCLALLIFVSGLRLYRYKLPRGSAFARIFKVLASTARNQKASLAERSRRTGVNSEVNTFAANGRLPKKFKFLDKALADDTVSASEVEETRAFFGLIPIFASTILMNCCLAQLQTFSVEQGSVMDRMIRNFKIPTQSLTVLPLTIMLASIPVYERFRGVLGDKQRARAGRIFEPLPRIGLGLALASLSMAIAAAVEVKRRGAAANGVVLSVFWLAWQYLLIGVSDMLTLGGMLEFFYSRAPGSMRSACTALAWCSTSMGYFLSSALVSAINSASGRFGREWLGGNDLNRARLDLYYALLCVLNFLNLLNYIFWAKMY